jgi:hypothetical protein
MKVLSVLLVIAFISLCACSFDPSNGFLDEDSRMNQTEVNLSLPSNKTQVTKPDPILNNSLQVTIKKFEDASRTVLVKTPGNDTILIDTGTDLYGVLRFLKENDVELDKLIITNDVNNDVEIVKYLKLKYPDLTIFSNGFIKPENSVGLDQIINSDIIVNLVVPYDNGFWPEPTQNSIVVEIGYHNFSMLVMGDCNGVCEDAVIPKVIMHPKLALINNRTSIEFVVGSGIQKIFVFEPSEELDLLDYDYVVVSDTTNIYSDGGRFEVI